MAFEVTTTRKFAASHQLRLYDGSIEPLHGHNWRVRVTVMAKALDCIGVVMDFHELETALDAVIAPLHNRHLNDLEAFAIANPSAEQVALHVGTALKLRPPAALMSVEVWETDENSARYLP